MKKIFSKIFGFLGKALSEDNGLPSSARLIVFISFFVLIPCIAFALVYTFLTAKDISVSVLTAVLAFLSSLFGIKAYQKGKEVKADQEHEQEQEKNIGVQ